MRLHRFYVPPAVAELGYSLWLHDGRLLGQWTKVLRYRAGDEVVLFDGVSTERLYKIAQLEPNAVKLELVTEFERKLPARHIYLFFSLLKKDKNEWVLQKCTELGVSNFVPIIATRCERSDLSQNQMERWQKIIMEAAEQCGRSDIPQVREPLSLETALAEYKGKVQLLVADEKYEVGNNLLRRSNYGYEGRMKYGEEKPIGVFIGPEGGWTEAELKLFEEAGAEHLHLGNLTLRAETAAVAAAAKLLN